MASSENRHLFPGIKKATNTTVLLWASVKIASGPCQSIFSVLTLLEHVGSVSQDSRSAPPGTLRVFTATHAGKAGKATLLPRFVLMDILVFRSTPLQTDVKHLQRSQNLRIT